MLTPPASERMTVGVVVERRRVESPWQDEHWRVVELLPEAPAAVAAGTPLGRGEGWSRHYAGAAGLELFSRETDGYRNNLASSRPAVYVILRRDGDGDFAVLGATVDPGEIEAHADAGDDLIEAVPLPPAVAAWMEGFVARHHVERPFYKRQRDRPDPEALGSRRPGGARPPRGGGEGDDDG